MPDRDKKLADALRAWALEATGCDALTGDERARWVAKELQRIKRSHDDASLYCNI